MPGMRFSSATTTSLRCWKTCRLDATKSWGPVSAACAAAWLTEHVPDVLCDYSLTMALISSAGPAPKPTRQPVIA